MQTLTSDELAECIKLYETLCETKAYKVQLVVKDMLNALGGLSFNDTDMDRCLISLGIKNDSAHVNQMGIQSFIDLLCKLKQYVRDFEEPPEKDSIDAFVAVGGNQDKSGQVSAEYLRTMCKKFELTIDIESLIKDVDTDGSGEVDYSEFLYIFKESTSIPLTPQSALCTSDEKGGREHARSDRSYSQMKFDSIRFKKNLQTIKSLNVQYDKDAENQFKLARLSNSIGDDYTAQEETSSPQGNDSRSKRASFRPSTRESVQSSSARGSHKEKRLLQTALGPPRTATARPPATARAPKPPGQRPFVAGTARVKMPVQYPPPPPSDDVYFPVPSRSEQLAYLLWQFGEDYARGAEDPQLKRFIEKNTDETRERWSLNRTSLLRKQSSKEFKDAELEGIRQGVRRTCVDLWKSVPRDPATIERSKVVMSSIADNIRLMEMALAQRAARTAASSVPSLPLLSMGQGQPSHRAVPYSTDALYPPTEAAPAPPAVAAPVYPALSPWAPSAAADEPAPRPAGWASGEPPAPAGGLGAAIPVPRPPPSHKRVSGFTEGPTMGGSMLYAV